VLKLVGSVIIVFATTLIGFRMAHAYRERPRELRRLLQAVQQLQAEVEYHAKPLPRALIDVGQNSGGACGKWFVTAAKHLQEDGRSVAESFAAAAQSIASESAYRSSDFDPLDGVAASLATMDALHLHGQFQLAAQALEQAEVQAREEAERSARLWQYLGVLAGVLLVILLY